MIARLLKRKRGIGGHLKRLAADETGAQGLELLLIFTVIVLPLLAVLIIFRDAIGEWVRDVWENIRDKAQEGEDDLYGDLP